MTTAKYQPTEKSADMTLREILLRLEDVAAADYPIRKHDSGGEFLTTLADRQSDAIAAFRVFADLGLILSVKDEATD